MAHNGSQILPLPAARLYTLGFRKRDLLSALLTDLGQPGIQRPSFRQLTHAVVAVVKGTGPLSSFVPEAAVEEQGLLAVTCLRGALTNLQSYQGAAFQLSCYEGDV